MSLILAIVADHHQAAQLTALVKRLDVDLVQAAEVGEGLLALNDRIPDLVLTPPLMSPFDDGVLDEYLRDLGPAGAHVQSLRIPVLSTSTKKSKRGGFSLFGRAKDESTLEGCDPRVFADEISQYLMRAEEEKHNTQSKQPPSESDLQEAARSGDGWSPGAAAVAANEEKWDPLAWQADVRGSEPDTPTPIYAPEPADTPTPIYSPVAADTPTPIYSPEATDAPAPIYSPEATDAPAAIYSPEATDAPAAIYSPDVTDAPSPVYDPVTTDAPASVYDPIAAEPAGTDDGRIEYETAPALAEATTPEAPAAGMPAPLEARAFDAPTTYAPIEEEPASISAGVVLPEEPSPDPDEPVVRAPLSLFKGVEEATDPALFLPSVEEPPAREPLTLFRGVDEAADPTEYLRPMAAESIVEPVAAEPALAKPALTEQIAAEPILAEPAVAEPVAAEPVAAPIIAEPIVTAPPRTLAPVPFVPSIGRVEMSAPPLRTEVFATPKADAVAKPVEEKPAPVAEKPAPVAEKPAAPKLTTSFRSALAAIRKAWDAPAKKAPLVEESLPATAPAEVPPAIEAVAPVEPAPLPEPASQPIAVQPAPPVDAAALSEPEGEPSDVYEITVEPDLQELESKLLAPLEPRVKTRSSSEEPVGHVGEPAAGEARGSKEEPRGRRKKSSKKGAKAASQKARRQDQGPVQDEWGIFDPERCGFAALVDKLEEVSEVSEEKEQAPRRKGTKVRVISYS